VIALADAGRLKAHTTKFDLDEAHDVLKKLKQGEISGRAVLSP
jgi:D-arabinose 1-dehydrogenase-like Zn-dependent alcohol dehydrogenase